MSVKAAIAVTSFVEDQRGNKVSSVIFEAESRSSPPRTKPAVEFTRISSFEVVARMAARGRPLLRFSTNSSIDDCTAWSISDLSEEGKEEEAMREGSGDWFNRV